MEAGLVSSVCKGDDKALMMNIYFSELPSGVQYCTISAKEGTYCSAAVMAKFNTASYCTVAIETRVRI